VAGAFGICKRIAKIMDGIQRKNIKIGAEVKIVLKKDQRSGELTEGWVKDILTKAPKHPHGIKVRLEDGQIGRVKEVMNDE
jgi:uncharacterized repeat protein (TIGR03833 family)